jgi:hypothetical protein
MVVLSLATLALGGAAPRRCSLENDYAVSEELLTCVDASKNVATMGSPGRLRMNMFQC